MTQLRGRPANAKNPLAPPASALRAARLARKLSQPRAAYLAGVSLRSWSRWETGKSVADALAWTAFLEATGQVYTVPDPAPPTPDDVLSARAKQKLSVQQASALVGVAPSLWLAWEQGRKEMPGSKWRRWHELALQRD